MRNQYFEARVPLERACPLMELLPSEFHEGQQYTKSCFKVLRECYKRIYSTQKTLNSRSLPTSKSSSRQQGVHKPASIMSARSDFDNSRLDTSDDGYDDNSGYSDDEDDDDQFESSLNEVLFAESDDETAAGSEEEIKHLIESRITKLRAPFDHLRSERFPTLPIDSAVRNSNYKSSHDISRSHSSSRQVDPLLQTRQSNAGRRQLIAPDLKHGSSDAAAATAVYSDADNGYDDVGEEEEEDYEYA